MLHFRLILLSFVLLSGCLDPPAAERTLGGSGTYTARTIPVDAQVLKDLAALNPDLAARVGKLLDGKARLSVFASDEHTLRVVDESGKVVCEFTRRLSPAKQ